MNHKRISRLSIILVLALVLILVSAVPASATAERKFFTGTTCPITQGTPDREWISEDGVLHQRGVALTSISTSANPYLAGLNSLVANFEINLLTGAVHVYGPAVLHPAAHEGTWVGHFSTHVSPLGVIDGSMVMHGTGDLEGLILFNTISNPEAPDPACNNVNTSDTGYVLIP
jgi:hypothetical protein